MARAWERKFINVTQKLLDKQLNQILDNIAHEQAISPARTKAFEDYSFDQQDADNDFKEALPVVLAGLAAEASQTALEYVNSSETLYNLSPDLQAEISRRVNLLASNFNNDTKKALTKTLTEGFANNDSIAEIKQRVVSVYDQAKGYRTERLARSETQHISNYAARDAYRSIGVTQLEWHANPGACEYCLSLDGTVVGVEDNFATVGQNLDGVDENGELTGNSRQVLYDNVMGGDAHLNCECTILPVGA